MSDQQITCSECGDVFVFTAAEKSFYDTKGLASPPKRCKPCRQARKASGPSGGGGGGRPPRRGGDSRGAPAPAPAGRFSNGPSFGNDRGPRSPHAPQSSYAPRSNGGPPQNTSWRARDGGASGGGRGATNAPARPPRAQAPSGPSEYRSPAFPEQRWEPRARGARPEPGDRGATARAPRPSHAQPQTQATREPSAEKRPQVARAERPDRPKYDITCGECGVPAQVPFKPLEGRQVFCQECYRARRGIVRDGVETKEPKDTDNGIVE
jgi:CxxC-x17-CxxC domain-containing protein